MRGVILKIHLATALIAGTFMVLLGATGSIIAFQPELDRWVHRDLSYVTPGDKVLSLAEIGAAVSHKFSNEPIVAFLPATSPQFPTQVILSRGVVSVNPYTAQILGVRTRGQTFLGLVRALHTRLAGGDWGRGILRWTGVAMLLSLVSGLWLWWPGKRLRVRGSWRSAGFWFDLHRAVGIVSLLPLLVLAATGVVIGFEDQASALLDRITGSRPGRVAAVVAPPREAPVDVAPISPDQAVAIATAQLPGAVPYRVQMPRYGGVYVVALATQQRILGGDNAISIDPWSGKILAVNLSTERTSRERLMAANEAIHTGEILGMPSRVLAALAGIVVPVQAASGLVIWLWKRKKVGQRI